MISISRLLRSQGLALALFLLLATVAAVGTWTGAFGPAGSAGGSEEEALRAVGLAGSHTGRLVLLLLAASVVNVSWCTFHRLGAARSRHLRSVRGASDLAMHASVVLILGGGLVKGLLGFVGTQHVRVGEETPTVYDWRAGEDARLGFSLSVLDFQEEHYPARVRLGVSNAATGTKLGLLELVEGRAERVPGSDVVLAVVGLDAAEGVLRLRTTGGGDSRELLLGTGKGGGREAEVAGLRVTLVAWRSDVRSVKARVSLSESGAEVLEGTLEPNARIFWRGTSLFLTAWGRDREGHPFIGVQAVRDPGAPLFWAGCILLAFAVPLHLFAKGRRRQQAGTEPDSGGPARGSEGGTR